MKTAALAPLAYFCLLMAFAIPFIMAFAFHLGEPGAAFQIGQSLLFLLMALGFSALLTKHLESQKPKTLTTRHECPKKSDEKPLIVRAREETPVVSFYRIGLAAHIVEKWVWKAIS